MGDDQRVLEDLALRVTAADPGEIDERHFKQMCGVRIVATAERRRGRARSGCYFAGRQAPVTGEAAQSGDAHLQTVEVSGSGFGEGGVKIGKGEAGVRKMPPRMRSDLGPCLVERRGHVIEAPAPKKRCRVG